MSRLFPRVRSLVRVTTQALHIYEPLYRAYAYVMGRERRLAFDREFDALEQELCAATSAPAEGKKRILVTGILQTEKKPTLFRFFEQLGRQMPEVEWIFLDEQERPAPGERLSRHYIPRAIRASGYEPLLSLHLSRQVKRCVKADAMLRQTAELLHDRQQDMTTSYAKAMAYRYDRVYREAIAAYQPAAVIIWSQFPALHMLCRHVCQACGVPAVYMEYGSLPGTFSLDAGGQMGESRIARDFQAFRRLPVSPAQLQQAEAVLAYLRESRLNRNRQDDSTAELKAMQSRLTAGKPVVLFAGHNDFDSGLLPYDAAARENHSPMFATSGQALACLASLADEGGFQLVYKPHPAMIGRPGWQDEPLPASVHLVLHTDIHKLIDMADLVVTVVSQTGYVACIRGKPTLTLGYNQLRGKGAAYEAYTPEQVLPAIRDALHHGFTPERRQCFLTHAAQMLAYGLYDDLTDRPLRFGQPPEAAAHLLAEAIGKA